MRTSQIKQQLHDYIDSAEDKKLKAIYTLVKDDIDVSTDDSFLTAEQKSILDQRYADHLSGKSKSYTWEETIAIAERGLKERKAGK
ncbi:MAG TPA: addiction module protein [Mucilaginibacter sp.]